MSSPVSSPPSWSQTYFPLPVIVQLQSTSIMEETKSHPSPNERVILPSFIRQRHVPDVPEDVDFLMEHLNDPNYDLKKPVPSHDARSSDSLELENKKVHLSYSPSDIDAESHMGSDRYSTSRAESRNSTAIDFDECAFSFHLFFSYSTYSSESPYPEVRAAVASVDDPTMPVNTFRM